MIDPITLEIVQNGLRSITDESFIALMKSAYSTNIKERRDHSCAVLDLKGRLIAQAENSLPIHLASMWGLMTAVLGKIPVSDMAEGDIFIANDPHVAGGTHLPDVNMAMPVFIDGKKEMTLRGPNLAQEFKDIVDKYVETRYPPRVS